MGGVEPFIIVGRIVRPHGIRGEVKVAPLSDWPERFKDFHSLYLESEGNAKRVEVEGRRVRGNQVILKLSGVNDREGAESLRGVLLKVREETCPPLPEDTHYVFDLVGLEVKTTGGERVGSVVDVLQMPAHDVYVVDARGGEVLIPAVKTFIKRVDIEDGVIVIEPIEGLLD